MACHLQHWRGWLEQWSSEVFFFPLPCREYWTRHGPSSVAAKWACCGVFNRITMYFVPWTTVNVLGIETSTGENKLIVKLLISATTMPRLWIERQFFVPTWCITKSHDTLQMVALPPKEKVHPWKALRYRSQRPLTYFSSSHPKFATWKAEPKVEGGAKGGALKWLNCDKCRVFICYINKKKDGLSKNRSIIVKNILK